MTQASRLARGLAVAVVATSIACAERGTPAPPITITDAALTGQREAVLAYAATLDFDSVTHGAYDRQRLTLYDSAAGKDTLGPLGAVYPERRSHLNDTSDLSGPGRIVAMIVTDGPYPKLGLTAAGVVYVWVDRLRVSGDSGSARAVFVPADPDRATVERPVRWVRNPPRTYHRQALARWLYYRHQSEFTWETCTKMGCCEGL